MTVEAATVALADVGYPRCIGGEGACPPEDCGGIPGYERLREVLADPSAPEHEDVLGWLDLPSPGRARPDPFRRPRRRPETSR